LLAALAAALTTSASLAQSAAQPAKTNARVFGVLSLVGDRFDLLSGGRVQKGAHIHAKDAKSFPVIEAMFDDRVVNAAASAIKRIEATAEVSAINSRSKPLFDKQYELFTISNGVMTMPEPIRAALKEQQATHLVLVRRGRDGLRISYTSGEIDLVSNAEGLGFYISDNYFSAFLVTAVHLVELSTGKVLSQHHYGQSQAYAIERLPSDPAGVAAWDLASNRNKSELLLGQIDTAMKVAVSRAMGALY
jgi:hypothetical protein